MSQPPELLLSYWSTQKANMFSYLTIYGLILLCFAKYVKHYLDLILLFLFITLIGSYTINICPGYLKLGVQKLSGPMAAALDAVVHWLPLGIVILIYYKFYKQQAFGLQTCTSMLLILAYLVLFDVQKIYDICLFDSACVSILAFIVYLVIMWP